MGKGLIAIFASILAFAIVHFGLSASTLDPRAAATTFIGGTAFLLMGWALVLAARPRWLEGAFGGLDKMYLVHKRIGVTILLLILVHFIGIPKLDAAQRLAPEGLSAVTGVLGGPIGMVAMVLLILSVIISLNRKIPYHIWLKPHRLMGILFGIITFHMLLSPKQLFVGQSPSGVFLLCVAIIGITAYIYRQIFRNRHAVEFSVEAVNKLERATEIILAPKQAGQFAFKAGQFGFLRLSDLSNSEAHPFTIASAPDDKNLRFTTKVLGDFTRKIRDDLKTGGRAWVEGPYGKFATKSAGQHQVWVAGGIGITPFLSSVRDLDANDTRDILLVYCVQENSQALFADEFSKAFKGHKNRRMIILQSNDGEFATADLLAEKAPFDLKDADIFLCGPKPLTVGLKKGLASAGVAKSRLHSEAFEFR